MAELRSLTELDVLQEEFIDRFGPPPEAVNNLSPIQNKSPC